MSTHSFLFLSGIGNLQFAMYLEVVLVPEFTLVGCLSLGSLENHLADSNAGLENKRKRSQVSDLKHLAIVDSGLDKTGGHMNDQAHSSKAAPAFQPTANRFGQFNPFVGDPQDRLPWHQGERFFGFETLRESFDRNAILDGARISQFFENSKLFS
jgi:hypothetical protein